MGYRERKALRGQQQQEAFGKGLQNEQRVTVPVPTSLNLRDGTQLDATDSPYLLNVVGQDNGVRLMKERQVVCYIDAIKTTREENSHIVTYTGSGSASAECWVMYYASGSALQQMKIANIGEIIESGVTATASAVSGEMADANALGTSGSWIEFKKTIIYVTGSQSGAPGIMWNRASAWQDWSVSVSGGSANSKLNHWGIHAFKNRTYTWHRGSAAFTYGSVDQIIGLRHTFDLGGVLGQDIMFMTSMSRDGGSGPDDFAVFVGVDGGVAVYQGSNPGDANDWGLVGIYQIGKPISKNGWVKVGNQVLITCEDDLYILPDDLQGTRQGSKVQRQVAGATSFYGQAHRHFLNAIYEPNRGLIIFGDGTTLNTNRGLEGSHTQLNSAEPYLVYSHRQDVSTDTISYSNLGVYKGRIFALTNGVGFLNAQSQTVWEIDSSKGTKFRNNKVYFGELPTRGRANASLVNPVIRKQNSNLLSTSTSTPSSLVYRVAAIYDDDLLINTSIDPALWQTASADLEGTFGDWMALFGTGDNPQVALEVLSASSSAEFVFTKMNITVSDTGGI